MKQFSELFSALDQTTKTNVKVDALADYFAQAPEEDCLWTIALLSHRRPKRTVNTSLLREWGAEFAGIPLWLFEESYHVVGDLAETIALVSPTSSEDDQRSLTYWIKYIQSLGKLEEEEKKEKIIEAWQAFGNQERFIFNKLITGGFRMGVSQKLMLRALSKYTNQDETVLAHRIMGDWSPDSTTFKKLILEESYLDDISRPYPFYLAYPLEDTPDSLGETSEWTAEHKWDGIRGQVIIRKDELFVWSRGEELVTDKYPEFHIFPKMMENGIVLDGEILPFKDGRPLPFIKLQTRIGRKNITKKVMNDAPVVFVAYDLLEIQGKDIREKPFAERRKLLEGVIESLPKQEILKRSELIPFEDWGELVSVRKNARQHASEGLMIKRKNSPYRSGRKRGDWWKWKVDPLTVDAVMIYAQSGHGRRANLFTDYTFAVWNGDELVPFTKAYSGLTDREFQEVTQYVRQNTIDRFGPVRSVKPSLVFEIAFEGINASSRHKSGIALRFPRIARWRKDKPIEEANTLDDLKSILEAVNGEQGKDKG